MLRASHSASSDFMPAPHRGAEGKKKKQKNEGEKMKDYLFDNPAVYHFLLLYYLEDLWNPPLYDEIMDSPD